MQASNRRNDQTAHISLQISINVKERRRQKIQHRAISLARRQTSSPSLTTLPSFGGAVSRPITPIPQEQKQPNTQLSSQYRRISLVSLRFGCCEKCAKRPGNAAADAHPAHPAAFRANPVARGYCRIRKFALKLRAVKSLHGNFVMGFQEAIRTCIKEKYATFSGRASRSEYWWFVLFVSLVAIALGGIGGDSLAGWGRSCGLPGDLVVFLLPCE